MRVARVSSVKRARQRDAAGNLNGLRSNDPINGQTAEARNAAGNARVSCTYSLRWKHFGVFGQAKLG